MLDTDLADFEYLRCQIGTLSWTSIRYAPMAFTEHGAVMMPSVLNSERAIEINNRIILICNKMHEILKDNKDIWHKLEKMQITLVEHENSILAILEYIKQLEEEKQNSVQQHNRKNIGYT